MLYNSNKNKNVSNFARNKVDMSSYLRNIFYDTVEWQPQVKKISPSEIKRFEKREEREGRYWQRKK